jgi:mono/diheme cytochrome c family protein
VLSRAFEIRCVQLAAHYWRGINMMSRSIARLGPIFAFTLLAWPPGIDAQDEDKSDGTSTAMPSIVAPNGTVSDSAAVGEQVYRSKCSSCHRPSGEGLPSVFPSLKGNAVVTATDPSEFILTVLNGLEGKVIDGQLYPAPMPSFGDSLSDEEIASVINHARTTWGHTAPLVTAEEVEIRRR